MKNLEWKWEGNENTDIDTILLIRIRYDRLMEKYFVISQAFQKY